MADSKPSKFAQEQAQPLFIAVPDDDPDLLAAYDRAGSTISRFIAYIQSGSKSHCAAKLRFRDPDASEQLGEDWFVYLWLSNVVYHADSHVLSGVFFEVPPEFHKWHQVGQRLAFDSEDVFDWMVLSENGTLHGGYTLRVTRSKLPENERPDYDRYIGVREYEPEA